MPSQEPVFAWPFGNGPVRVGTQGLFRPCLKTFVAPFLPAWLTAPGSSRMWLGQRLSKNLFWRPASMCPFQNGLSTSRILNKSTVSAKFTCDDLCGESENYWERVMWWYFARIKCGNIVSGWLWIVLSVPQTWLIVWFPEVVDRQISGMSWRSCYKNIVYKNENALLVFTWSDFVLDNRLWVQERWILGLFNRASRYEPHSLRD